jgi:hypothetical protein
MTATEVAAWIGACSGGGSLLWNVYTKLTAGPKLEISAYAGMVQVPPPPGNPKFLSITLHNRGTAPTTVNSVTFHSYPSRWSRFRRKVPSFNAVLDNYQGPPYPKPLEIGGEWVATVRQEGKLHELLGSKDGLWVAIHHSFAKKPTQVKVIDPTR